MVSCWVHFVANAKISLLFFLWLSSIPWSAHIILTLSVPLLLGILVVSISFLLWIKLLYQWGCRYSMHVSFCLSIFPEMGWLGNMAGVFSVGTGISIWISVAVALVYSPTKNKLELASPHPHQPLLLSGFCMWAILIAARCNVLYFSHACPCLLENLRLSGLFCEFDPLCFAGGLSSWWFQCLPWSICPHSKSCAQESWVSPELPLVTSSSSSTPSSLSLLLFHLVYYRIISWWYHHSWWKK